MVDSVVAPIWLGVNLLLFGAGWQWSRWLFGKDQPFLLISATILFWWAAIVAVALVTGLLGILTPLSLMLGYATVAVAALGALRLEVVSKWLDSVRAAEPAPADVSNSHSSPTGWNERWIHWINSDSTWLTLWAIWLAYAVSRIIFLGVLEFPDDWDTLMYHLPLVDQWIRARSLYAPDDAVWYNPATCELIGLSLAAPFSGDFYCVLQNLPVVVLMIASAVELGRCLGFSTCLRHLTALAVVSNMVVFRQMLDAKNDLAVVSLLLTGAAFGFRFASGDNVPSLFATATAVGLMCGIKYYAVGYAGILGAVVFMLVLWLRGWRKALTVICVFSLAVLVFAGYWYVRNFIYTGTPIYPKGLTTSNDLVQQVRPNLWSTTLFGNEDPAVLPLALSAIERKMGYCNLAAFLMLPISLPVLIVLSRVFPRSGTGRSGATLPAALGVLALGTGLVIGFTPFTVETAPGTMTFLRDGYLPSRFGLSFLAITIFCFAFLCQYIAGLLCKRLFPTASGSEPMPIWKRLIAAAPLMLFCLLSISQMVNTMLATPTGFQWERWLLTFNLVLAGWLIGMLAARRGRLESAALIGLAIAGIAGLSYGTAAVANRWHAGFARHYDNKFKVHIFHALESSDSNDMRICVLGNRYYPFLGSRRQHSVCRPAYLLSEKNILRYLRDQKVTLVASARLDVAGEQRLERKGDWISEYAHLFNLHMDSDYYQVWMVRRERLDDESLWVPIATLKGNARPK